MSTYIYIYEIVGYISNISHQCSIDILMLRGRSPQKPWKIPSSHSSTAASQVLVPSKPRTDQNQIFEAGKFRSKTQQKRWGILAVGTSNLVGGLEHFVDFSIYWE